MDFVKKIQELEENINYLLEQVALLQQKTETQTAYTVKQAALKLNIVPGTLREWIKAGKIQATKTGKTILISFETLNDFLKLS